MCGRYILQSPVDAITGLFSVDQTVVAHEPRYNIAPTQDGLIVRENPGTGRRELAFLRWGLLPPWAKDLSFGNRLINSRCETAATKPSFRSAFRSRRCMVVANGFYEWVGTCGAKRPHYLSLDNNEPFGMAGLWESWRADDESEPLETFTILTCESNEDVRPIHHRMPVILKGETVDRWLDVDCDQSAELQALLKPLPNGTIQSVEVSSHVNSPRNDDARCLEPIDGLF